MDVYTHIKNRCIVLTGSTIISYVIYSTYSMCIKDVMGVVNSRSIINFCWQSLPLVLVVPTAVYFVFLFMSAFFSRDLTPNKMLHRGTSCALGYGGITLALGTVLSIITPFHLLITVYVYCFGGGPFPGIYYT